MKGRKIWTIAEKANLLYARVGDGFKLWPLSKLEQWCHLKCKMRSPADMIRDINETTSPQANENITLVLAGMLLKVEKCCRRAFAVDED